MDANALLSAEKCHLFAAYPLFSGMLGLPAIENGKLPEHEGGRGGPRGQRVRLGVLVATHAYHAAPLEIILGSRIDRQVKSLADLKGLKLGARAATLAGTLLLSYKGGVYMPDIVTLPVREDVLPALEDGKFDATLVERHHFDAWKKRHPDSKLKTSGYYHPVIVNFGYTALETNAALVSEVNIAIGAMIADGTAARIAAEAGMTFFMPTAPEVIERLTPGMLAGG
ncbi:transporter substrate-binding domain-containing protein [Mesorhizobium sp. DCY119]|uniref:substrate-binding periplasmic protein n=1 Tax=Mesorhizobium sp. DCY119 TaxID=2108445 RepID=UPI0013C4C5E1|nr:transporter substrate-binding domain-containing protein [Mesorhizobium sp. DCY119]